MRSNARSSVFVFACTVAVAVAGWIAHPADAQPGNGLPDLTIDARRLERTVIFRTVVENTSSCEFVEGCANDVGSRLVMRFDVATPNIGTADMVLGNPADPNNPNSGLFVFSTCHNHYHFEGYAKYELFADQACTTLLAESHKRAFCLEDYARYDTRLPGAAKKAYFTCGFQGISVGWEDIYSRALPCQFMDVTDAGLVPGQTYWLRVRINPVDETTGQRALVESRYDNNEAVVPVQM